MRFSFRTMTLLVWLIAGASGGAAWHHLQPAVFEARTRLQVLDAAAAAEAFRDPELRALAGRRLLSQESSGHPDVESAELSGQIRVVPTPRDKSLHIAYLTRDRGHAVAELTALVEAYFAQQAPSRPTSGAKPLQEVQQERARLESERHAQEAVVRQLAEGNDVVPGQEATQAATLEKVRTLGRKLAEVRTERLLLERQLLQVSAALEQQMPLELIAAALGDSHTRELVTAVLTQIRLAGELKQAETALARVSPLYGRRHPELAKLAERIADLRGRLGTGPSVEALAADGAAQRRWLLESVQAGLAERRGYEQELQDQLELEQTALTERTAAERERGSAATRLAGLQTACEEADAHLARLKAAPPEPADALVESPWLAPAPVSPSLGLLLLIGSMGGLLLAVLHLVLRGRASAKGAPARPSAPRASPGRRESLQQRREQRLALAQPARH